MDYQKQCWYCKAFTMLPKGSYYQCSECGATWNEQPNMTGTFIDIEPVKTKIEGLTLSRPIRRRRSTIRRS